MGGKGGGFGAGRWGGPMDMQPLGSPYSPRVFSPPPAPPVTNSIMSTPPSVPLPSQRRFVMHNPNAIFWRRGRGRGDANSPGGDVSTDIGGGGPR